MKFKVRDPMLLPLRDPKKRELELKLLAEYEKSGKIKRVDSQMVEPKQIAFGSGELLEELGADDGNFRVMKIDDINAAVKIGGDRD